MRSHLWTLTMVSVLFHLMVGQILWYCSESTSGDFGVPIRPSAPPTRLVLIYEPTEPTLAAKNPSSSPIPHQQINPPKTTSFDKIYAERTPAPLETNPTVSTATASTHLSAPAPLLSSFSPSVSSPALVPELPDLKFNRHQSVVFLLDVSGSMYEACQGSTRLILAQQALAGQISALPDGTSFAVVVYAEKTARSGPLKTANTETKQDAIQFLFNDFNLGGGTNLPAGLIEAQALHPTRIILATDGDLNMADTTLLGSAARTLGGMERSPNLTILAIFPRANTDAEMILPALADQQGGHYLLQKFAPNSSNLIPPDATTASASPHP